MGIGSIYLTVLKLSFLVRFIEKDKFSLILEEYNNLFNTTIQ